MVLEAQLVWIIAVILPVAGSARASPDAVSTHTALGPATICGAYPPLSTGRVCSGVSESRLIKVMRAAPGPVINVYATLVVRLARSSRFTRRGAFQSAAQFQADAGGICTVHLMRSDEGRGVLQVGYSDDVADVVRFQFERFVAAHLERRATPGTVNRVRLYRCPDCGTPFSAMQVEAALRRGRSSLLCPVDETRVTLEDSPAAPGLDAVTRQMNASADAARGLAAASSIVLGKEDNRL